MRRATRRALGALAAVLLGGIALAGLALSAAYVAVSTDLGRAFLMPRLARAADDAIAGRIELDSFRLEPRGGLRLQGLRVFDPDGDLVLSVKEAFLTVNLVRLRSRTLVLRLDADQPVVLLKREEDGSLSLARAFAPAHPSPPTGGPAWTIRVEHLAIHDGGVRYATRAGTTAVEAAGVSLEGRGEYGREGSSVELRLRTQMVAPAAETATLELRGALRHGAFRISVLKASFGDSAVEAVAEGDLLARSGRVAVLSATLSGDEARVLVPRKPLAGALSGVAYAESDGREATTAVDIQAGASRGGSARAAAAMRLSPGRPAAGFQVALDGLDPSKVLRGTPPGSITFTARGRAAGRSVEDLRGSLALSIAPSRLRGGRIGPGELAASASAGSFEVGRLALSLPGGAVEGSGRYALQGSAAGQLSAEVQNLALMGRNLEALLGSKLPHMAGRARLSAKVEGPVAAPTARISISAPAASLSDVAVRALSLSGELRGPRAAPQGRFEGAAAMVSVGRRELRRASLRASVLGRSAGLDFTGLVPDLGQEPVAVRAFGELTPDRARILVSALTISYPGTRFALVRPAEVVLAGPSVDRLELSSGDERIVLAGGIRGRSLDVTAGVEALALGRLPSRLLPPDLRLDGILSAQARATGRMAAPGSASRVRDLVASASGKLSGGRVRGVSGLSAEANLKYDGERERAVFQLDARRAAGGELSARGELPADPARAGPQSSVSAKVALRSFPLADIVRLAAAKPEDWEGVASLEATLSGTAGSPALSAEVELAGAAYGDWGPAAARATLQVNAAQAKLGAVVDLRGARLLVADGHFPVDLPGLLREPRRAPRNLALAPIVATIAVPGFDVSRVAGMGTIPAEISGSVAGRAALHGTWRAPRFQAELDLSQGAYKAYAGLGLHAEAKAGNGAVELAARGTLRASEILRLSAQVGRPLEKLAAGQGLDAAPFSAEILLPETALEQADPSFPVSGRVEGNLKAGGTLGSPRIETELRARRLSLPDGPIGDLDGSARYAGSRGHAHAELRAARGGSLQADLSLTADLGMTTSRRGGLGASPAEARLLVKGLDLGFLPLVVPGLVRSAQGTLDADVRARGPISRMKPAGTIRLEAKRVAVVELGEWTDIVVDASVDEDVFRVAKIEAHRGKGWVAAELQGRGLSRKEGAELKGTLVSRDFTISRAGQDLATLDLDMTLGGRLEGREVRADLTIPRAVVNLPVRSPRPLQALEGRSDITIGRPKGRTAVSAVGPGSGLPLHALVHVLAPNKFFVKSESPRLDIELKADVTLEVDKSQVVATGTIDTLHGFIEPMGNRVFTVDRGRIQFMGGPPEEATLDVNTTYNSTVAKVHVAVTGPVAKPEMHLSSQPPLDESQIALLIATGRTEFKANSGAVDTLSAQQASGAALGAVATQLFKDLVASKLPLDSTIAVEPGQVRAGVYLPGNIYLGYTRRLEAQPQQGQNQNEGRIEWQISPHWSLESRYGDAGSGGADLIWSRDY